MHLLTLDNVIKNPNEYLEQIKNNEFRDIEDAGENKFKNIHILPCQCRFTVSY